MTGRARLQMCCIGTRSRFRFLSAGTCGQSAEGGRSRFRIWKENSPGSDSIYRSTRGVAIGCVEQQNRPILHYSMTEQAVRRRWHRVARCADCHLSSRELGRHTEARRRIAMQDGVSKWGHSGQRQSVGTRRSSLSAEERRHEQVLCLGSKET
ncbi:hypothetical protein OH76DRAFT_1224191 [Lentinus brumalis]|uniref:Uncharacterized protein n=1 Tax=Lentinus brumalis TaxID=2498619 RepID=A0A371DLS3_9APHY|nr:hypothetical protein OH76DRAFT_1224191 [Polyporus brumalis]